MVALGSVAKNKARIVAQVWGDGGEGRSCERVSVGDGGGMASLGGTL